MDWLVVIRQKDDFMILEIMREESDAIRFAEVWAAARSTERLGNKRWKIITEDGINAYLLVLKK